MLLKFIFDRPYGSVDTVDSNPTYGAESCEFDSLPGASFVKTSLNRIVFVFEYIYQALNKLLYGSFI